MTGSPRLAYVLLLDIPATGPTPTAARAHSATRIGERQSRVKLKIELTFPVFHAWVCG